MVQSYRNIRLSSRLGAIVFKNLFTLIFSALAALSLYLFAPPYFDNWRLGSMLKSIAASADPTDSDELIKTKTIQELTKHNIIVEPKHVRITRRGNSFHFALDYVVLVSIPFTEHGVKIQFHREGGNMSSD